MLLPVIPRPRVINSRIALAQGFASHREGDLPAQLDVANGCRCIKVVIARVSRALLGKHTARGHATFGRLVQVNRKRQGQPAVLDRALLAIHVQLIVDGLSVVLGLVRHNLDRGRTGSGTFDRNAISREVLAALVLAPDGEDGVAPIVHDARALPGVLVHVYANSVAIELDGMCGVIGLDVLEKPRGRHTLRDPLGLALREVNRDAGHAAEVIGQTEGVEAAGRTVEEHVGRRAGHIVVRHPGGATELEANVVLAVPAVVRIVAKGAGLAAVTAHAVALAARDGHARELAVGRNARIPALKRNATGKAVRRAVRVRLPLDLTPRDGGVADKHMRARGGGNGPARDALLRARQHDPPTHLARGGVVLEGAAGHVGVHRLARLLASGSPEDERAAEAALIVLERAAGDVHRCRNRRARSAFGARGAALDLHRRVIGAVLLVVGSVRLEVHERAVLDGEVARAAGAVIKEDEVVSRHVVTVKGDVLDGGPRLDGGAAGTVAEAVVVYEAGAALELYGRVSGPHDGDRAVVVVVEVDHVRRLGSRSLVVVDDLALDAKGDLLARGAVVRVARGDHDALGELARDGVVACGQAIVLRARLLVPPDRAVTHVHAVGILP